MIFSHEGISFAETGRDIERIELNTKNNSIVLMKGDDSLSPVFEKKIGIVPVDENFWFGTTAEGRIYCSSLIYIYDTSEEEPYAEIKRYSNGRSKSLGNERASLLEYRYSFSNDTLKVDSFFGLPEKARWNGAMVRINIFLPEGTKIFIDEKTETFIARVNVYPYSTYNLGGKWWTMTMTDNGLRLK
jgi:hypothetical protein